MAYFENNELEYDESGYESLEHRAFQWRDLLIKQGGDPDKALKQGWKYVEHEEHKDPYGY
jgi:hypothetical protein